jgi:hypothetical protein
MPGEIEARDMAEQSTPLVVAFANLKGGVGKSTLAVNVAGALGASWRVVLADADPQGTATAWGEAGRLPFKVVAAPLTEAGVSGWLAGWLAGWRHGASGADRGAGSAAHAWRSDKRGAGNLRLSGDPGFAKRGSDAGECRIVR